jgi:hypothetical protein
MIAAVVLGTEALAYVRDQLGLGRTLAREIQSHPPAGRVITFAPQNTSEEDLNWFDGGCLGDTIETFVPVWELARDYLNDQSGDHRYLICEDTFASNTEPAPSWVAAPWLAYQNDRYHFLPGGGVTSEQVRATLRAGDHYPWIAVLTSLPSEWPALQPGTEQPRRVLVELARRTEHVLVGAYDEEGWLIWSPGVE